ncbi:protein sidekick-1-like [Branchiostoma floridae x Branchiostoma japonicum]
MAVGHSQTLAVTKSKTIAVYLSLVATLFTLTPGRVAAIGNPTPKTERSADDVVNVNRKETLPPTNVRVESRNLYNEVCWDAAEDTRDNSTTFDAQYIDDMEYTASKDTWRFISDCKGVSGPCCTFFDDISVKDEETGKPLSPRTNGWWVRARAVGTLGPSRWTTTSEWFSPFKHTVIGPPDVDVIATPANEESASQLRELNIRIKHPVTPYYMYNEHNQITMATMGDIEGFFVFYNVSYWMDEHRENSRDFVVGKYSMLNEEYSMEGFSPGTVYCVEVTGFVDSIWVVRKGLPSEAICKRTADAKPSTGPTNVTWRPLPAANCSAATRSFRAVRVRWSPPPANDANGVITGYKVTISLNTETGEHVTIRDSVDNHIQLSDLTTFHAYTVQLSACTSAGCTQGERVRIPPHAVKAVAPMNLTIAEVASEKVAVTWLPPGNGYDCVDVYKLRFVELSGDTVRQITVTNTSAVLHELRPGTSYNVSVSAIYKLFSHGSKSPAVESPPTPWLTVSTRSHMSDYKLIIAVLVVGHHDDNYQSGDPKGHHDDNYQSDDTYDHRNDNYQSDDTDEHRNNIHQSDDTKGHRNDNYQSDDT